jgi:hypothetical protein
MRPLLPIIVLVCSAWAQGPSPSPSAPDQAQGAAAAASAQTASNPADENSRKAKMLIDQAIAALGGETYLTIRDREQQGRGYVLHHGRAEGGGNPFWDFIEYPDKERVEITKERDIAELYVGDKAWEITYKGPRPIDQKDLDQYLRRRHYSLDAVLRTWVKAPGVILLYEGNAIAAQHPAQRVTLVNAQNESVTLFFDDDTHLPVKKSFEWRDPTDRQKNLEEEIYENYRSVSGIMAPFNVTRYFNGDMASQRFFNSVTINQGLDPAMFDPNSGYNPNKPSKVKK